MALFVQLGEENPAYDLITVVQSTQGDSKLANGPLYKLVEKSKYADLLDSTIFACMDQVLSGGDEKVEAAFTLALHIVQQHVSKTREEALSKLSAGLRSADKLDALLKLRLLNALYNLTPADSAERFPLLVSLLETALSSGNAKALAGQFDDISSWVSTWKLSTQDATKLYQLAYSVQQAAGKPAQGILFKLLKSVEGDKDAIAACKDSAAAAVVVGLKSPTGELLDALFELEAVQALKGDATHGVTFDLLAVYANGTLADYQTWYGKNQAHLAKLGISHPAVQSMLTTLTVSRLAFENEVLSYQKLQDALALDGAGAVEEAVVNAVASGMLSAKLDQEKELIIVERSAHAFRHFGPEAWQTLGAKLAVWASNVEEVLRTLHQVQSRQDDGNSDYEDDDDAL